MKQKNANSFVNDGIHEDALISEKVGDWLMENQSMMTLPIQGTIYQSQNLEANSRMVRGNLIQISQIKTKENCYLESWRAIEGLEKLVMTIDNDQQTIQLSPFQQSNKER